MLRHGEQSGYPVLGETDGASHELIWAIKTAFPLLPDAEIMETIHVLRASNDLYAVELDEDDE